MKIKPQILALLLITSMINQPLAQNPDSLNADPPDVRVGYFDTHPLSFRNSNGDPDGLIIDLLNEVAATGNMKIQWVYDEFPNHINNIKSGRIDVLVSVAYSEERARYMDYSALNFTNVWGQVFLPANSDIESLFDLNNKSIALLENGINGQNFLQQCELFEVNCQAVYANSYHKIFTMVDNGEVDAAVSNNMVGAEFQDQYDLLASSIVFNPFKVYITKPLGADPVFLNLYDQRMRLWKDDPESFYYQTRMKWTHQNQHDTIPYWILYTILGLFVFALIAIIAAVLFKRQVNRRVNELSQREIQLNQIINIVPHMIYANDYQGRFILANDFACDFFGIENKQVEKENIYAILKSSPNFQNLIAYTTSSNPFNTEIEARNSRGEQISLMMSKVPYSGRNDKEPAVVTVGVDISQTKQYEEEIEYLANHDALTGLPNRLLLSDRLKSSLARAEQFKHVGAILYIDLDNFKNINDSQGHKVGDKLIKKVAIMLKKSATPGDTIARLGGDEFVIEIPELDQDINKAEQQALLVAEKLSTQLKKPIIIEDKQYNITASIGVVVYPRDGNRQSLLIQRADTAMYEAKFNGRNRIQVFEKGLEAKVKKQHQLENDLRLALQNKEIVMVYQPIVAADSLKMVGTEILLRWHHPVRGTIMPTDFIPIAESAQLILEIGYWTIEKACQQILTWRETTDQPFFVAINLSVIQFRDREFLGRITDLVNKYNIPRNYLEFEVTESILLNESVRSMEVINQLKMLGIKLSIDDFGTGYSSFDYIRKLPLDKIKIDKSFIEDIPSDNNSVTIVKTILNMAHEMNLQVVAEGVENKEQMEFLREHQCQFFQGYLFSKPKEVNKIPKKFRF
ncbi:EAL domain-containing protein [Marinicella sediminis]|uniref:EAL domain-containing protein n=1 Tax=Marinicella sediminis TaxID=1792834 RepID=A0ABV7JBQ7_9GAMM|nr:EAL domain-containing protein [Marinicella sediminis]